MNRAFLLIRCSGCLSWRGSVWFCLKQGSSVSALVGGWGGGIRFEGYRLQQCSPTFVTRLQGSNGVVKAQMWGRVVTAAPSLELTAATQRKVQGGWGGGGTAGLLLGLLKFGVEVSLSYQERHISDELKQQVDGMCCHSRCLPASPPRLRGVF